MLLVMIMGVAMAIGASFGVKGGVDVDDLGAKLAQHGLDHMIGTQADGITDELHRQMAIAEMPGDARQVGGGRWADFHQRFWGGMDLDDTAVLQAKAVAVLKAGDAGEIDKKGGAAGTGQGLPASATVFEVEGDAIDHVISSERSSVRDLQRTHHQNRK